MDKEKKLLLLFLRIVHILCLVTIPAAIIELIFILASGNFVSNASHTGMIVAAVLFYLFSFNMLYLGYKWPKISKHLIKYINKLLLIELYLPNEYRNHMDVFMIHLFRILLCFETVVLFGFFLGMIGNSLYPAIPLIILAAIALILTYPTNRRVEQWLSKQEIA